MKTNYSMLFRSMECRRSQIVLCSGLKKSKPKGSLVIFHHSEGPDRAELEIRLGKRILCDAFVCIKNTAPDPMSAFDQVVRHSGGIPLHSETDIHLILVVITANDDPTRTSVRV